MGRAVGKQLEHHGFEGWEGDRVGFQLVIHFTPVNGFNMTS